MSTRYGFGGGGDSASVVLSGAGGFGAVVMSLPGGVVLTISAVGAQQWSYRSIHGDVLVTAGADGKKGAGPIYRYDPFGQPLNPSTGAYESDAVPASLAGALDNAWLGQHQRPYEHTGSIATVEMGLRQYVPALGRFLQVDPVPGGSCSAYDYLCAEPINGTDLTGAAPDLWPDGFVKNGIDRVKKLDYGTVLAGTTNVGYGGYKVYSGVQLIGASPACFALGGAAGMAACVGVAGYQVQSGKNRIDRGLEQFSGLGACREDCGIAGNAHRFVQGLLPKKRSSLLDWLFWF